MRWSLCRPRQAVCTTRCRAGDAASDGAGAGCVWRHSLRAACDDCVTQWELAATCEKISEAYLLPVIEALLAGVPLVIIGFLAENGSEYINHKVAKMLDKLAA